MTSPSRDEQLEDLPVEPLLTREYETRRVEMHDRLRRQYGSVAPVGLLGQPVWLVLDYPQALSVMTDAALWKKSMTHWRAYTEGRVPKDWPPLPALECDMLVFFDDERHAAARASLEAALAPFQDLSHPTARRLEELTREYADDLITFLAGGAGGNREGMADLCGQFARPLPMMVVNQLLGFPVAKGDEVIMDVWRVLDAGPEAPAAIERLMTDLRELAEEKRARPGDDMPSYLLAHNPEISTEELAWELYLVMGTTADEVSSLIASSLVETLRRPRDVPPGMRRAFHQEIINNVVVANPPMHNLTFRFPVADTELGDFRISAGDPVMVSPAAVHNCPHFGAGATRPPFFSSRDHISFGVGPHRCPAKELAMMIVGTGLERITARFEEFRLTMPEDQLPWRSSPFFGGLRILPVQYRLAVEQPSAVADPRPPERADGGAPASVPAAGVEVPAPSPGVPAGAEGDAETGREPAGARGPRGRQSSLWRLMAALRRKARRG
ncbi:cytochrome [Streptomyces sp. B6B3]|uniref:cytochrome n=1 Tax=Streptomyces sp. B6B3 TaxID=3153570 RepID=UPI00325EFA2F